MNNIELEHVLGLVGYRGTAEEFKKMDCEFRDNYYQQIISKLMRDEKSLSVNSTTGVNFMFHARRYVAWEVANGRKPNWAALEVYLLDRELDRSRDAWKKILAGRNIKGIKGLIKHVEETGPANYLSSEQLEALSPPVPHPER